MHVVRYDPGEGERARDINQTAHRLALFGQPMIPAFDGYAAIECVFNRRRCLARAIEIASRYERRHPATRAPREREQPARVLRHEVERHGRLSPRIVHAGPCDERGEISVSLARLGEEYEMRDGCLMVGGWWLTTSHQPPTASHRTHFRPDDSVNSHLARCLREPHRASELVVIRERERRQAQIGGARRPKLRQRRALEEGEAGMTVAPRGVV